jgi:hypothetical protein
MVTWQHHSTRYFEVGYHAFPDFWAAIPTSTAGLVPARAVFRYDQGKKRESGVNTWSAMTQRGNLDDRGLGTSAIESRSYRPDAWRSCITSPIVNQVGDWLEVG